ncbi:hypothetical protein [Streptomyces sp. NPDC005953]|uniref:hypothetical protein n=1 Tax=Streptomyces sp. NPDC005953 TaxID=3156719 RepID=UPI0033FC3410
MTVETWVQAGMALVGATGGVVAARSARRTRAQERRDDFRVVTDRMNREILRQGNRISELETETEAARLRMVGQDHAIRYLVSWVRGLYAHIRKEGSEPPAPPDRMPPEVEQHLHDLGV